VSAPSEEAAANRPADGTDDRNITSRKAIIECDSVREIITISGLYQKNVFGVEDSKVIEVAVGSSLSALHLRAKFLRFIVE
jgi:hypothetical protein